MTNSKPSLMEMAMKEINSHPNDKSFHLTYKIIKLFGREETEEALLTCFKTMVLIHPTYTLRKKLNAHQERLFTEFGRMSDPYPKFSEHFSQYSSLYTSLSRALLTELA